MNPTDDRNEQLRDLKTHQSGISDRHETRSAGKPSTIEPGRSPGAVPDPDDAR